MALTWTFEAMSFCGPNKSGAHIRLRKWDLLTNAWMGAAVQASEAPNADYRYPQVRWTSTGNIVAVYSGGPVTQHIYRKTFNADLLAQTPEVSLQSTTSSLRSVRISINAQDQLFVCSNVGTGNGVTYTTRVLDPAGNVLMASGMNSVAWNGHANVPCEVFDNGSLVVANSISTSLNDPEGYNVRANYGLSLGSPNTGYQIGTTTITGEQRYPDMAKLPNAGFILVWNGNGFQGDTDGVYARAFHAAGLPGLSSHTPLPIVVEETGTTQDLGLRLGTPPTGNVVVDLAVSDPTEATLGTAQLTFTPANWSQVQQVTITGVDDAEDDGDITLHVTATMNAATADPVYAALPAQQYAVVNRDDDATFSMPGAQSFCRTQGIADVPLTITNNGDPVGAPVATSNDQSVVPNAALTVVQTDASTFHVTIASLAGQPSGTATITVAVTDGSFTYSDVFDVTTLGTAPLIDWVDMELVSTPAVTYQWHLDGEAIAGATGQAWVPEANGNYTVLITDTDGCGMMSETYFFGTTGVDHLSAAGIRLHPQPATDLLTVDGVIAGSTYRMVDARGSVVAEGVIQQAPARIATAGLARGMHVLLLAQGARTVRVPVVLH